MADVRVGISGWLYPRWRGTFYPRGLPHARELSFAARQLNSIEINGSFYSLQRPECYRRWYDATPPDFLFAVKGGRFITHMKKLRGVETALANFFASGLLCLREKLGPMLWQLPPQLPFDEGRLAEFFALLPRDTRAAARLARTHDARLDGRAYTRAHGAATVRHALEVRHPSYVCDRFVSLLREHSVALVVADTAQRFPLAEDVTADFVYVRLHGETELYASGYDDDSLDAWATRVRAWRRGGEPRGARRIAKERAVRVPGGRDVYVYFDNDAKVRAPFDAMRLARRLTLTRVPRAA
jgi:uncharacterized protein YecE (DUF72 family)